MPRKIEIEIGVLYISVATKQNATTFTAQRIPTKGRKTARTPATQKGVKAKRVISRRPMSGKMKSTLKSKKQQMGHETTLSSIGSLLDRCPGGVKSMAINSPGKEIASLCDISGCNIVSGSYYLIYQISHKSENFTLTHFFS